MFIWEVVEGEMRLNALGKIVYEEIIRTPQIRPEITLDAFVVMLNHVHVIVFLEGKPDQQQALGRTGRAPLRRAPRSLATFVSGFKATVTWRVNRECAHPPARVWQRNYYEHVLRGEGDLHRTREYIEANPGRWEEDPENPGRKKRG